MKKTTLFSTALAALLGAVSIQTTTTLAQTTPITTDVPRSISYQGLLTDNDGKTLPDGDYHITISLYADPTGTVKLWQETYTTSVIGGIFNLYLGSGNRPLPSTAAMNTPLWIGTQVGDSPEMYPLTPLSASPYALNVPDHAITTGKLADGAVTAEKISANYIGGIAVNGLPVTAQGTVLNLEGSEDIRLGYDEMTNSITIAANKGAQSGPGDSEKGIAVQDNTDGSENWLGRDVGANQPTFQTPVGTYNTLAGGYANSIGSSTDYSGITAGHNNSIDENNDATFIGGGELNAIGSSVVTSVIAGGYSNDIGTLCSDATISGGRANLITRSTGTIGGGNENEISAANGTIGGGSENTISTSEGTIAGGLRNAISGGNSGTIGGGQYNTVNGAIATIAGGRGNTVDGNYSAIPGGDNVATTGYAQTSMGFYNASRGALAAQPTTGAKATNNDPLFMIGNGTPATVGGAVTRSNAFEVSYNGHSVVYDINGTTRTPIKGATYVDNIIYAWGDITSGGTIYGEFGVVSVTHTPFSGVYDVRIDVVDPVTGAPVILTTGSVTATLTELDESTPCAFIHASRIGAYAQNQFRVRIRDASCQPLDAHFMFKVTGRP